MVGVPAAATTEAVLACENTIRDTFARCATSAATAESTVTPDAACQDAVAIRVQLPVNSAASTTAVVERCSGDVRDSPWPSSATCPIPALGRAVPAAATGTTTAAGGVRQIAGRRRPPATRGSSSSGVMNSVARASTARGDRAASTGDLMCIRCADATPESGYCRPERRARAVRARGEGSGASAPGRPGAPGADRDGDRLVRRDRYVRRISHPAAATTAADMCAAAAAASDGEDINGRHTGGNRPVADADVVERDDGVDRRARGV